VEARPNRKTGVHFLAALQKLTHPSSRGDGRFMARAIAERGGGSKREER